MKASLQLAIDQLYQVFEPYFITGNLRARSCPCCVSDATIQALLSQPLRAIDMDTLGRYFRKAITTFGAVEDYKHFLPRLLELMANSGDVLSDFLIFERLNYSDWYSWPEQEITALQNYFLALIETRFEHKAGFDFEDIIELGLRYLGEERLNDLFVKNYNRNVLNTVVKAAYNDYWYAIKSILIPLYSSEFMLEKLENEFFKTNNAVWAQKVSIAYTVLESYHGNEHT